MTRRIKGTEAGVWLYSHFLDLSAIYEVSCTLANNFGWVDEILQDLLVNRGKGSVPGSLLSGSRTPAGLLQNSSLSNEDNVTVREFLFEFAGESLLDLVEGFEHRYGDEDDNCLLASTDLNLSSGRYLQRSQVSLEIGNRSLQVIKGLGHSDLCLVRGLSLDQFVESAHDVNENLWEDEKKRLS